MGHPRKLQEDISGLAAPGLRRCASGRERAGGSGEAALAPFIELAEVLAEAQVVEKIGIIGIQGKELL